MKGRKPKISESPGTVAKSGKTSTRPRTGGDLKFPRMPTGLSPSAKTAWKTLVDDLFANDLLESADWPLIEIAAVTIGRMREARRIVEREGLLADGQRGAMTKHPAYLIERENAAEVRHLLEHLGVGPIGRSRINGGAVSKTKTKTMTEEFDSKVGPSARQKLRALDGGKS